MRISPIRPRELGSAELARCRELQSGDSSLQNLFPAPELTVAGDKAHKHGLVAVLAEARVGDG